MLGLGRRLGAHIWSVNIGRHGILVDGEEVGSTSSPKSAPSERRALECSTLCLGHGGAHDDLLAPVAFACAAGWLHFTSAISAFSRMYLPSLYFSVVTYARSCHQRQGARVRQHLPWQEARDPRGGTHVAPAECGVALVAVDVTHSVQTRHHFPVDGRAERDVDDSLEKERSAVLAVEVLLGEGRSRADPVIRGGRRRS